MSTGQEDGKDNLRVSGDLYLSLISRGNGEAVSGKGPLVSPPFLTTPTRVRLTHFLKGMGKKEYFKKQNK